MALREFLSDKQVFTAHDFAQTFPDSQTDRNLLTRAVQRGGVDRVRRGLYVSKSGPFARAHADPFDVASAAVPDAVFCLLSALQLHGVSHNVVNKVQFYTRQHIAPFEYDGIAYEPHRLADHHLKIQSIFTRTARMYHVTTKEQTLVDGLTHVSIAGGPEHLLRSLAGFIVIDIPSILALADSAALSVNARLGWVLDTKHDDWNVAEDILVSVRQHIGSGPYYFWSSTPPKDGHWVKRWRLYLPYPEQEMDSWLNL